MDQQQQHLLPQWHPIEQESNEAMADHDVVGPAVRSFLFGGIGQEEGL